MRYRTSREPESGGLRGDLGTLAGVTMDVQRYLDRIGFTGEIQHDLETLAALQYAHLCAVPFENLYVFFEVPVRTDLDWSVSKIVHDRRGGWCFESNGAFGALLDALGFAVLRLGAAVLFAGPITVVDHLTLEVQLDQPYLVDVGFGESFNQPLALNNASIQDGGNGRYQFIPSSQGTTLTKLDSDDVPVPQYRFKRVAHQLPDFDSASDRLQQDLELQWRQKPFATRLLGDGSDRVTLLKDRLKVQRGEATTETPVAAADWEATLLEWFDLTIPT